MIPIYVMSEHPNQTADLQAILAQPACTGLLVAGSQSDSLLSKFPKYDAMAELCMAAGKQMYLGHSPAPMAAGASAFVVLDGENWPCAWTEEWLDEVEAADTALVNHLETAGYMDLVAGCRLCFSAGGDNDCEQGFHLYGPTSGERYDAVWAAAGLTQAAVLAAVTRRAKDMSILFPDVSMSLLDPINWHIQPDNTVGHRDMGAFAALQNAAAAAALDGVTPFSIANTNFSPKLAPGALSFWQAQVAANRSRAVLQLDDTGTTDADFIALVQAAAALNPDRIELHQRQATPGMWAGIS